MNVRTSTIVLFTTLSIIILSAWSLSLPRPSRMRLSYSNGLHDIETTVSRRNGFWFNFLPTKALQNTEQKSVDEHLKFLKHRYYRLRADEEEASTTQMSAWGWLMDNNESNKEPRDTQQKNALQALGVAELASEWLLDKHQPNKDSALTSSVTKPLLSGGLFGRPKVASISSTLNPRINTIAALKFSLTAQKLKQDLIKVKQNLITLSTSIRILTCCWSVISFLALRLNVALGPIFNDA